MKTVQLDLYGAPKRGQNDPAVHPSLSETAGSAGSAGCRKEYPAISPHTPHKGGLRGPEKAQWAGIGDCGVSPEAAGPRSPDRARLAPARAAGAAAGEGKGERGDQPQLHPYQLASVAAIESEWSRVRATLLVLATGCGKTVVFAELVRREVQRGGRALVLAHRRELLEQARAKLRAVGVDAELEQGKHRASSSARCVVASVDTLRGDRLLSYPDGFFSLIVVDEAHHAVAEKYGGILGRFRAARVLGVTATPDRLDGKGLGRVFDSVAYRYEMGAAIAAGYLAPLEIRHVRIDQLDLDEVSTTRGDFDRGQLSAAMRDPSVLAECCRWILDRVGRQRTIAFCVDTKHAADVADALNRARPGTAIAIDGKAKEHERHEALRRWRSGEISTLVNCELYTEGFDEPSVEVIVILRPTQSRGLYTQIVGRGTRLSPGKERCLVLDLAGNSRRHRLACAADALIGAADASAELRAELERLLEAGGADAARDVDALLAQARQNLAGDAERQQAAAVLAFRERLVDPFLERFYEQAGPVIGRPASPQQLAALAELGIASPPPALSQDEATRWIRAAHARRRRGLCTIKQGLFLGRWGLDTKEMPMQRATDLVIAFKAMGPGAFKVHAARQPEWRAKS